MKALKASLKHWQDNIEFLCQNIGCLYDYYGHSIFKNNTDSISIGEYYCPLCWQHKFCGGCPVRFYVEGCVHSPWSDLDKALEINTCINKKIIELAEMEYIFLLNIYYAEGGR